MAPAGVKHERSILNHLWGRWN